MEDFIEIGEHSQASFAELLVPPKTCAVMRLTSSALDAPTRRARKMMSAIGHVDPANRSVAAHCFAAPPAGH